MIAQVRVIPRESKGVRRPNNRTPEKDLIVHGLVQGTGPCTLWNIPSDIPS